MRIIVLVHDDCSRADGEVDGDEATFTTSAYFKEIQLTCTHTFIEVLASLAKAGEGGSKGGGGGRGEMLIPSHTMHTHAL